jgi:hypothetical protein
MGQLLAIRDLFAPVDGTRVSRALARLKGSTVTVYRDLEGALTVVAVFLSTLPSVKGADGRQTGRS